MDGVNCLQGHVTFDQNGNRETLVQINQNKREWKSKSTKLIVHIRVAFCLGIKTSFRAKPFIQKCDSPTGSYYANQTHFHIKKVLHENSF